jgi:hypothetical protein
LNTFHHFSDFLFILFIVERERYRYMASSIAA